MSDQPRHESPEIGAMIGRMLNALIRRAADGDSEALEALRDIERMAPEAMSAGLALSRSTSTTGPPDGYSLAYLADVMGVTRSAIQQRTAPRAYDLAPGCGHATCVGVRRCRS